jgi:chromosome segregation ATPase
MSAPELQGALLELAAGAQTALESADASTRRLERALADRDAEVAALRGDVARLLAALADSEAAREALAAQHTHDATATARLTAELSQAHAARDAAARLCRVLADELADCQAAAGELQRQVDAAAAREDGWLGRAQQLTAALTLAGRAEARAAAAPVAAAWVRV